ncbi:hypothetical protein PPSIR1_04663 [Plesiocystis pacifica SIR-1]|uniref:Uncharacterized protein n=2 Tax=Plesiocystis pacifica TaxID=191768 RepID=A6FWQ5_9BACT|nr:hypothetical protein PPSIR1_04663 [Plesiocystis pacifica SIR-1]
MSGSNHQWDIIGKVVVARTSPGPIDDAVWMAYVKDIEDNDLEYGLALTKGALDISALQRKAVADAMNKGGLAGVVVTDERLVRGLVTAVSWLGLKVSAFSWDELDGAIDALKTASAAERDQIKRIAQVFFKS